MSRADKITPLQKIPEYYADFDINLSTNQVTGQLARVTNGDAVAQSIVNLILTNQRERFYQPHLGSQVEFSLFGQIDDPMELETLRKSVETCCQSEPRAQITNIEVRPDMTNNGYQIVVVFTLLNIQQVFVAQAFIQRVR